MRIFLIFLAGVLVVLTGCAGITPPPVEEEVLTIGTDQNGNIIYKYQSKTWGPKQGPIRLAKAANTTPENAAAMTDPVNTRVTVDSYGYTAGTSLQFSQSDFEARRRNLMRRFVEPPKPSFKSKPKPQPVNFPEE